MLLLFHGLQAIYQCERERHGMRRKFFPITTQVLVGLFAVFAIWLVRPVWLPGQMIFYLFIIQAVALFAFMGFQSAVGSLSEPEASQDDNAAKG